MEMISITRSKFLGHIFHGRNGVTLMNAAAVCKIEIGLRGVNPVTPLLCKNIPLPRYLSAVSNEEEKKEKGSLAETAPPRRFLPMTRRTLCRKLLEDGSLYAKDEHIKFQDLATGLDSAISRGFHGTLGEMKSLYDPLNPDKETIVFGEMSKNERLDNEFWLLQKLSSLLEKAHFYELPREIIDAALEEHAVYEGVMVSVDTSKYDVLRFWVLGEDTSDYEFTSTAERLRYYSQKILKKVPESIPRYKRVVVAVRTKKQSKLMLKAFKDIPRNSLEYLLPEGSIRMKRTDKGLIATTVFIALMSGAIKLASSLSEYHVPFAYIAGLITFIVALRAWTAYKNKRNSYLLSLSKLLYFKTVANNRALLALIVDRAEDETFKSTLIAYTFLRALTKSKGVVVEPDKLIPEVTAEDLKSSIEEWLRMKYKLDVHYSPTEPIKQLEDLGLLTRVLGGDKELLSVVSIDEALRKVPVPPIEIVLERKEDLELEELSIDSDESLYEEKSETQVDSSDDGKVNWK